MNPTYDFSGQVALVTGVGVGMGLDTARAFAAAGTAVVLADVNDQALRTATDELTTAGHRALGVTCDVADEGQVAALVDRTVAEFGRLDMTFNNAGIMLPLADAADEPAEALHRVTAINLRGVWACMKHELRQMRAQGSGAIVNCSSLGGLVGGGGRASYHATKHGVLGLTKSAALEFDTSGVDSDGEFGLKTTADGTSLLMWLDVLSFPNSMEQKVRYAIRPDGSGFGPTLTVTEGVGTSAPLIAFGPNDTAVAVWDSVYVGRSSVQTARVPLDGTTARAEQIGVPTLQPGIIEIFMGSGLDVDAAGNAALAWTRGTDTDPGPAINYKLAHEIRIFDANPPTIANVQVPETALTDVPVGMSVTATDLTPVKIRWTVNKFTTLQGPQIAPTYTTTGLHKVGIEVTDAVGHTTFASRAFTVTQNPAPPPPEPHCPPGQVCQ